MTTGFAILVYGTVSDRYGTLEVLSGLCSLAGSAICFVALSASILSIGRLVQATGATCGGTLVRTIARGVGCQEHLRKGIA